MRGMREEKAVRSGDMRVLVKEKYSAFAVILNYIYNQDGHNRRQYNELTCQRDVQR